MLGVLINVTFGFMAATKQSSRNIPKNPAKLLQLPSLICMFEVLLRELFCRPIAPKTRHTTRLVVELPLKIPETSNEIQVKHVLEHRNV